jgi:uncharacterized SAM-dependent methyltransferase
VRRWRRSKLDSALAVVDVHSIPTGMASKTNPKQKPVTYTDQNLAMYKRNIVLVFLCALEKTHLRTVRALCDLAPFTAHLSHIDNKTVENWSKGGKVRFESQLDALSKAMSVVFNAQIDDRDFFSANSWNDKIDQTTLLLAAKQESSKSVRPGEIPHVTDRANDAIDPLKIDHSIKESTHKPIRSLNLFHSPLSALLWDQIVSEKKYRLYDACEAGLKQLICETNGEFLKGVGVAFNYGAGSPSKDAIILTELNRVSPGASYVWVEASYPMLNRTTQKISVPKYPDINLMGLIADFESPKKVFALYERTWPWLPKTNLPKVFFLLGFTLSNLDAFQTLQLIQRTSNTGDKLVFPMQFIPHDLYPVRSSDEIKASAFCVDLVSQYRHEHGVQLANSFFLLSREYKSLGLESVEIRRGEDEIGCFVRVEFCVKAQTIDAVEDETRVITASSTRYFETDFFAFTKKIGFKTERIVNAPDSVKTILLNRD